MTQRTSWGMGGMGGMAVAMVLGIAPHAAAQIPGWEKPAGWVPDPSTEGSVRARASDPRAKNLSIQAGGGYTNFRDKGARGVTDAGTQWNLRAVFGFARPLGVEFAYVGAAHGLNVAGLEQVKLVENGLEWLGRAGYPFFVGRGMIAPYLTAGFGWGYWDLVGERKVPDEDPTDKYLNGVQRSDVVLKIPVGVGISTGWRSLSFDARAMYRRTFEDELLEYANPTMWMAGLDSVSFGASLGYAF